MKRKKKRRKERKKKNTNAHKADDKSKKNNSSNIRELIRSQQERAKINKQKPSLKKETTQPSIPNISIDDLEDLLDE